MNIECSSLPGPGSDVLCVSRRHLLGEVTADIGTSATLGTTCHVAQHASDAPRA
jgi:hypothetical protein